MDFCSIITFSSITCLKFRNLGQLVVGGEIMESERYKGSQSSSKIPEIISEGNELKIVYFFTFDKVTLRFSFSLN